MALTLKLSNYKAGIESMRAALSDKGKTLSGAKDGTEYVYLEADDAFLEVLLQKSSLYILGFRGKGAENWMVFDLSKEEKSFLDSKETIKTYPNAKNKNQLGAPVFVPAQRISTNVGHNYNDLGAFNYYEFGKADIQEAVKYLSGFTGGKGNKLETSHVVILIFLISEAIRFEKIRTAISDVLTSSDNKVFKPNDFEEKVKNWTGAAATDTDVKVRKG